MVDIYPQHSSLRTSKFHLNVYFNNGDCYIQVRLSTVRRWGRLDKGGRSNSNLLLRCRPASICKSELLNVEADLWPRNTFVP